ncbi:hypothetical protein B9Q08_02265 [Candidatus Marsarchaeota G2 archaeon ECH_B_SAG-M15]|uniref:Uncharacterized protein n=1 Tax=Candidatus Marsarchaeota G2 archaeon ECH_B_SAG-M15 TaxID=1978162 RepID=A0A2R6AZJ0_9ARCH|nr:MAG: hypothetical protein B9Q08_02265 [Candidatus Marsarchaeota G2 archaeon ECH_B_SAG-M15]
MTETPRKQLETFPETLWVFPAGSAPSRPCFHRFIWVLPSAGVGGYTTILCSHNIYMGDMVKAAAEELAPTIRELRGKGYSYREIAQTLGVSTKLVYNVLHSAPDTGQDAEGNTKTDPKPNTNPHPSPPPTHAADPGHPSHGVGTPRRLETVHTTTRTAGAGTQTLEAPETLGNVSETPGNSVGKHLETPGNSGNTVGAPGNTPPTASGNTPQTHPDAYTHAKNVSETLGNSGNTRETGGKHHGNSWKQLETAGNVSGNTGGTTAAAIVSAAAQVGEDVWRERVEHLEVEVAYLRGLVDRLTEAVQRQTEALAREQTIVHELQAKLETQKTVPLQTPEAQREKRKPRWRFW